MPKFKVTAEFDLSTEIEPELYANHFDPSDDDVKGFEDNSYWRSVTVEAEGGSLSFEIEAEDEYAAESKAGEFLTDGGEVEDNNSLTWLIQNLRFEVEEVEEEMTLGSAKVIIAGWLNAVPKTGLDGDLIPSEVRKALLFLLERVA